MIGWLSHKIHCMIMSSFTCPIRYLTCSDLSLLNSHILRDNARGTHLTEYLDGKAIN